MKILCVIDAQPYFSASNNKKIIQSIVSELKKSISNREQICLIQYNLPPWINPNDSEIHKEILETVENYDLLKIFMKYDDSAASVIKNFVNQFSDANFTIKICGVNLEACIYKTLIELSLMDQFEFEILLESCAGEKDSLFFTEKIANIKNVKII